MTERVRSRTGTPTRWAGQAPDDADPTGGRHVLDQDAGLTPIFTTLRRGAWRPRPQPARRTLRPVPDPAPRFGDDQFGADRFGDDRFRNDRFRDDPWTAPIPVVPPLHAVGGYGPPALVPEPPASETETTAWGLPVVASPAGEHGHHGGGYDPDLYSTGSYEAVPYAGYEQAGYEQAGYEHAGYQQAPYRHDPLPYQPVAYEPAGHEPVLYGPPHRFPRHDHRPYEYDPLTDTGRHHRRLAPAGW